MKTFTVLLTSIFFAFQVLQAQPQLSFETKEHSFGQVEEEGGPVEHKFTFTNTGTAPLIIQNVKPSCGCTTPDWTKEPVMPGKEGFILAQYNPLNRPGAFNKSLTITSNAAKPTEVLYIRGSVEPKPASITDKLPTVMGSLRVRYHSMNMGKIDTKSPYTKQFSIYNDSDRPIKVTGIKDNPAYINLTVAPATIQPKTEAQMVLVYESRKSGEFGFVSDKVTLLTDDPKGAEKQFNIMATVEEYFPPMTEAELAKAPKLKLEETEHDFGVVAQGSKASTVLKITNEGKSTLAIRAVKPNCGCVVSKLDTKELTPGQSVEMNVAFDTDGRRGNQIKKVDIFTNDPTAPIQTFTLKARVNTESGSR